MSDLGTSRRALRLAKFKERRLEIWLQYIAGATLTQLAAKYHVTKQAISNLISHAEKEQYAQAQK